MYTRLQPVLYVGELAAEVDFYRRLGFEVVHDSPDFVGLAHGDSILFGLQRRPGWNRPGEQPLIWQIATDDIDAVHLRCAEQGIDILREPRLEDWGEWTMILGSPAGYRVTIEGARKA